MRRRDFLTVFAAASHLPGQVGWPVARRRGVHVPAWQGLPPKAELESLGLEIFERPRKALLPAATRDNVRHRRFRAFSTRAVEVDCLRAFANASGLEVELTPANLAETIAIFRKLAALDPWMEDAAPIADMGLLGESEPFAEMLLDLHEQYDVIADDADFSAYKLLIVPHPRKADARKLDAYRRFGGTIYTPPAHIPREAFAETLRKYIPKPAVIAPALPAEAEVTFLERRTPGGIRRTGHVLYYPNDKPGALENVQLSFRLPQHPLGVITLPDQRPVEFVHNEFLTTFTLPRVVGHRAIAFE